MKNQQIIEAVTNKIKASAGYHFSPAALEAAVEEGVKIGERVAIGGEKYATLRGAETLELSDKTGKVLATIKPSGEQLDAVLSAKARHAAIMAVRN